MSEWKQYQRKGYTEMRPYIPGERLDGISVSDEDWPEIQNAIAYGTPAGMIARNPSDWNDMWYVRREYYIENFVEID